MSSKAERAAHLRAQISDFRARGKDILAATLEAQHRQLLSTPAPVDPAAVERQALIEDAARVLAPPAEDGTSRFARLDRYEALVAQAKDILAARFHHDNQRAIARELAERTDVRAKATAAVDAALKADGGRKG